MASRTARRRGPRYKTITATPQSAELAWSGYTWDVRTGTGGPGPMAFGRYVESVFIDANGYLNLCLREYGGTCFGAEVIQNGATLGYGKYSFVFEVDAANLADNVVFGLFTYDVANASAGFRELDLEITRWGAQAERSRMWYSVQPTGSAQHRFSDHTMSAAGPYKGDFIWEPGQAYFRTYDADGVLLGEHLVTDGVEVPADEKVHINLWSLLGAAPIGGAPQSVKVRSFTFTAGITHPIVKAAVQTDLFNDSYGWALKVGASITGGQLVLICDSTYAVAYTGSIFDLTNSGVSVNISQVPAAGNGSTEVLWEARWDANNYLCMFLSGGAFFARMRQGGINTDFALPTYNARDHRWWRIENSGTSVLFRTSPDGSTWTTRSTQTTTLIAAQMRTLRMRFECGYFGIETGPQPLLVDSVNS